MPSPSSAQSGYAGDWPDRPSGTRTVIVEGGVATIDLPDGWRYLHRLEARRVIEQEWGNRPHPATLGLVLPPASSSWGGIIVWYTATGHVDDRGTDLRPAELLERLRANAAADSAVRRREGQPAVELVGWADPPHYDPASKKLRWGRLIRVGRAQFVNCDMRILGSKGLLVMTAVADAGDVAAVVRDARLVLARTTLAPALSYAAHDPLTDTVRSGVVVGLIDQTAAPRISLLRVLLRPWIALCVLAAAWVAGRHLRRRATAIPLAGPGTVRRAESSCA